jgi:hypothetical protein
MVQFCHTQCDVGGQEHIPIESRYYSGFFVLSVQVFVPSQGQELVPIAVKGQEHEPFTD